MILIGEKLNSSRKGVARAVEARDQATVARLAERQQEAGAHYLDVNAGTFVGQEAECLLFLMQAARQGSDLPLVLDSPNPAVLERAMAAYTGDAPILNSASLQPGRLEPVADLAAGGRAGVVALCMDADGVPQGADARLRVAQELATALTGRGVAEEEIYLDPLIEPVAMDGAFGPQALSTIARLRAELPACHIVCGLSNVSFGMPARKLLNRTFLVAAMAMGLDAAILDPTDRALMAQFFAAQALLNQDEFFGEYFVAFRGGRLEE
ncbi:MAG: dihydropteroate synthase [Christensenellales bacterium]|jgi:cobalamin-dependent methionine synthase I